MQQIEFGFGQWEFQVQINRSYEDSWNLKKNKNSTCNLLKLTKKTKLLANFKKLTLILHLPGVVVVMLTKILDK